MKKNTFYVLIILFSSFITNAQNEEFKPRNPEFEFYNFSNDTLVTLLKNVSINSNQASFLNKLPYPIIFIHGLNSSSETWNTATDYFDAQYDFIYGGRFDFCLSADGNHGLANTNFYPIPGADIAAFETNTIPNADYYYVNFDVNINGSIGTSVISNQSAVAKQGKAVKKVVERVLSLTGKDKVILVGHSMGGLASREYIQNSTNWQIDNYHHVAKLLSIGTPNGGSNASDNALAFFTGTDLRSEAIRDLKQTYYYSGEAGRFLFGGTEIQNSTNMNDNSYTPDFYNVDINCNGIVGETILGLNQKPIDNLIDYSTFIGRITNFVGTNIASDGIVDEPSSNLNYYYPTLLYPSKLFYFNSGYDLIENHTELTGYYYQIMQGLDEPNVKELAYTIFPNVTYSGFTTVQATGTTIDNDFFKFTISDNVNAAVSISNIVTNSMNAIILNNSGTAIGTTQNNSGGSLNFTKTLLPGTYYLKIASTNPTNTNYQTPYEFTIATTLETTTNSFDLISVYPNPVKDILTIENYNFTKASIYSILGELLEEKLNDNFSNTSQIDMTNYSKGMYILVLENETESKSIKIIKE